MNQDEKIRVSSPTTTAQEEKMDKSSVNDDVDVIENEADVKPSKDENATSGDNEDHRATSSKHDSDINNNKSSSKSSSNDEKGTDDDGSKKSDIEKIKSTPKRKGVDPPSMYDLVESTKTKDDVSSSTATTKLEPESTHEMKTKVMTSKEVGKHNTISAMSGSSKTIANASASSSMKGDGNPIIVAGNASQNVVRTKITQKVQQNATVGTSNSSATSTNVIPKPSVIGGGTTQMKQKVNVNVPTTSATTNIIVNNKNNNAKVKNATLNTAAAATSSTANRTIPQCNANAKPQQMKSVPIKGVSIPLVKNNVYTKKAESNINTAATKPTPTPIGQAQIMPPTRLNPPQSQMNLKNNTSVNIYPQQSKGLAATTTIVPNPIAKVTNITSKESKISSAMTNVKAVGRKDGSLVTNIEYFPSKRVNASTILPNPPTKPRPPLATATGTTGTSGTNASTTIGKTTQKSMPPPPPPPIAILPKPTSTQYSSPKATTSSSNKRQHSQTLSHHQHHYVSSAQKRKKFRSPLADMYHPYIQPTDTNLADARKRLQTALEQTRILRLAFTYRVYEKYRIILRMQSLALKTEDIVELIKKDPEAYFLSLMKDMDYIHGEKEMEKKEAFKLNIELTVLGIITEKGHGSSSSSSANPSDGLNNMSSPKGRLPPTASSPLLSSPSTRNLFTGIENSEQLSWYNSGLSLVVLPEEDVNEVEEQFDQRNITYRSPIDLETGQKVKDISPAAVAAANVMLDRVRKGKELRSIRRKQLGLVDDKDSLGSMNLSNLIENSFNDESGRTKIRNGDAVKRIDSNFLISSGYLPTKSGSKAASSGKQSNSYLQHAGQSSTNLPYSFLTSTSLSPIKKSTSHPTSTSTPTRGSLTSESSNVSGIKQARPRVNNSLVTLLSLSPTIEGRRKSGKLSACASALITNGISHIPSSKKGGSTSFGHGGFYNHHQHQQQGGVSSVIPSNYPSPYVDDSAITSSSPLSMRFKHPFPLSRGAKSMSYLGNGSLSHLQGSSTQTQKIERDDSLLLPPLMTSVERKKQKLENLTKFAKEHRMIPENAKDVVSTTLNLFVEDKQHKNATIADDNKSTEGENDNKGEKSASSNQIVVNNISSSQGCDDCHIGEPNEVKESKVGKEEKISGSKDDVGLPQPKESIDGDPHENNGDENENKPVENPASDSNHHNTKTNEITSTVISEKNDNRKLAVKRHISEIEIMDRLRNKKLKLEPDGGVKSELEGIDPILALSVLHALGYSSAQCKKSETIAYRKKDVYASIQEKLKGKFGSNDDIIDDAGLISSKFDRPIFKFDSRQSLRYSFLQPDPPNDNIDLSKNDSQSEENTCDMDIMLEKQSPEIKLASYVPSLRGGGEGDDSSNKDGSSDQNSSNNPTTQHQVHRLNNSDLLNAAAALWNEQNRSDLALLRAQAAAMPSMLSHHTQPSIDRYSLLPGVQTTTNPINLLSTGSLQVRNHQNLNHQSIPTSISGTHDPFIQTSNSTLSNQLHLAQNSLQQSPVLHNHILHHQNSDLNKYLNASLHPSQVSSNFASRQSDWNSLGTHNILTGNHHTTSISHTGIDPSRLGGLSSHQATLLVRERAAQVLLAREQQQLQARVAAAQRNAAALATTALGSNNSTFLFAPMQSEIKDSDVTVSKQKPVTLEIPEETELDIETENIDMAVDIPHQVRPTTAPAPSVSPRSSQATAINSILGGQRPSTVPTSQSRTLNSSVLLAKLDAASLSKLAKSLDTSSENESEEKSKTNLNTNKVLIKNEKDRKNEQLRFTHQRNAEESRTTSDIKEKGAISLDDNSKINQENSKCLKGNCGEDEKQDVKLDQLNQPEDKNSDEDSPKEVDKIVIAKEETSKEKEKKEDEEESKELKQTSLKQDTIENDATDRILEKTEPDSSAIDNEQKENDECEKHDKGKESGIASVENASLKKFGSQSNELQSTAKEVSPARQLHAISKTKPMSKIPQNATEVVKLPNINPSKKSIEHTSGTKTAADSGTSLIPPDSEKIDEKTSDLIMKGLFHLAVSKTDSESRQRALLEFLFSAGSAIPLSDGLVSDILEQDCNKKTLQSLKISNDKLSDVKTVVIATTKIWLWANNKDRVAKSSSKYGYSEVDDDCKWLLRAAVEVAIRNLNQKNSELPQINDYASEKVTVCDEKYKIAIACVACKSLSQGLSHNDDMDYVVPNFDSLVDHLDELRMFSLRIRSQERALLATLVSRRSRMSEAFSHAYTSSMVRAGEALGYDDLGEIVQDETTKTSTLLPFDILSDASRAWEDPCRPVGGFVPGLDSDELFKRAHARAIIQKSLKKLQDRHLIRGGTMNAGPYADIQPSDQGKLTIKAANGVSSISPPKSSPRSAGSASKRKASIPAANEGIGSSLFHPNHYSSPFVWDPDQGENSPYGRTSQFGTSLLSNHVSKRPRLGSSCGDMNVDTADLMNDIHMESDDDNNRSTREIEWAKVARMFRPVLVQERSSSKLVSDHHHHSVAVPAGSTIIAPFCRKLSNSNDKDDTAQNDKDMLSIISDDDQNDSESEEELDDEKILESHQKVLDHIREKFDAMMTIRQQIQERQRRARFA